jgi:hypothetical protein
MTTVFWTALAIISLPDVLAVLRARREDIPAVMRARRVITARSSERDCFPRNPFNSD